VLLKRLVLLIALYKLSKNTYIHTYIFLSCTSAFSAAANHLQTLHTHASDRSAEPPRADAPCDLLPVAIRTFWQQEPDPSVLAALPRVLSNPMEQSIPLSLQDTILSLNQFCSGLKTHLYVLSFDALRRCELKCSIYDRINNALERSSNTYGTESTGTRSEYVCMYVCMYFWTTYIAQ